LLDPGPARGDDRLINRDKDIIEDLVRRGEMSRVQAQEALEYDTLKAWVEARMPGGSPENPRVVVGEEEAWEYSTEVLDSHLSDSPDCQVSGKPAVRDSVEVTLVERDGPSVTHHLIRCPTCGLSFNVYYAVAEFSVGEDGLHYRTPREPGA